MKYLLIVLLGLVLVGCGETQNNINNVQFTASEMYSNCIEDYMSDATKLDKDLDPYEAIDILSYQAQEYCDATL